MIITACADPLHCPVLQLTRQNSWRASQKLSELMLQYEWNNKTNPYTKLVDQIQNDFQCCGALNGSDSWQKLRPFGIPLGAYPLSCCDPRQPGDESTTDWCDEQSVEKRVRFECLHKR